MPLAGAATNGTSHLPVHGWMLREVQFIPRHQKLSLAIPAVPGQHADTPQDKSQAQDMLSGNINHRNKRFLLIFPSANTFHPTFC